MTLPAAVSASRNEVRTVAPKLIELTETVVYPDIWERPGLSKRDRSLIQEIGELITHLAFYAGWPSAMSAAKVVKQVVEEEKA
ncbi:MAG TPA: carboxymuconolactone decarboxylase family protein [Methylomirabilota bacterium]|nr:carboxymuconolactone decarboxylase family protein [Methylomirabilota bacterium]